MCRKLQATSSIQTRRDTYLFRKPPLELKLGTELVHGAGVEVLRQGGAGPHPGQVQQHHPAVHPLQLPWLPQLSTGVGLPIIPQCTMAMMSFGNTYLGNQ